MVPARMLSTAFRRHGCTPTVMTTPTMHLGRHSPSPNPQLVIDGLRDDHSPDALHQGQGGSATREVEPKSPNRVDQRRRLVAGRSRLTLVLRGRTRTGLMPEAVESRGS
jgi:hypothetical protein